MMAQEKQLAATSSRSTAMDKGLEVLTRDHRLGGAAAAARAGRKKFINKLSRLPFYDGDGVGKVGGMTFLRGNVLTPPSISTPGIDFYIGF